jgi:hypothetical protein
VNVSEFTPQTFSRAELVPSQAIEGGPLMNVGVKHDQGKWRYDLFPRSLALVAQVFTIGGVKYKDRNWELGLAWGRVFAAMMRHAWAWWWGEKYDPVDKQHHLASVAWCALVLMEFETTHPELDDRKQA